MESNIVRQKLLSITQSFRIPAICSICNQVNHGRLAVCPFCISLMPNLGSKCQQCAYPMADPQALICGHCLKNPPQYTRAYIPYKYDEPLRSIIHQFKYHKKLFFSSLLAHLMYQAYPDITGNPQCLIPMPLHPRRLKQRGFNQTILLAKLLSKKIQLPYDIDSCQKIINTTPQAHLTGNQRTNNMHKAFYTKPMPYSHVLIIDDLLTTGNTANALAISLKKSGVERVDIWCCARAIYR